MPKLSKQAAAIVETTAGQIVIKLQEQGLTLREIETMTGVDKSQLSRLSKGLTAGEAVFRSLVRIGIERGVLG